jgi:LysR family transcriptional regulator, nitrogen assimilation regulatory protein
VSISLNRLRYFHAIATAGSISAAARALNVAQPALSYHLSAIERELGTTLLDRTNRGVSLTYSGNLLLRRCETIFRDLEDVEDEIRQTQRVPHGKVTVALAVTMARALVPSLLRIVDRDYPLLQLHIVDVPSIPAMEHIRDGYADLALAPNAAEMDNCETIAAYTERLCFVSRSTRKRRNLSSCSIKEMSNYPLVLARRNYDLRRRVEEAAIEAGCTINVRYEQESPEIIRAIVLSGLAGTVTQEALFDPVTERAKLDIRPLLAPSIVRTHSIVRRLDRAKSIAGDAVATALREAMVELTTNGVLPGSMV